MKKLSGIHKASELILKTRSYHRVYLCFILLKEKRPFVHLLGVIVWVFIANVFNSGFEYFNDLWEEFDSQFFEHYLVFLGDFETQGDQVEKVRFKV